MKKDGTVALIQSPKPEQKSIENFFKTKKPDNFIRRTKSISEPEMVEVIEESEI